MPGFVKGGLGDGLTSESPPVSSVALKDGKGWMMADTETGKETTEKTAPRLVKRWERPQLPERFRGSGLGWGNVLIVIAAFLAVCPLFFGNDYGAGGALAAGLLFWPLAGAALLLGMWVVSVSLILREIRLQAFEAAIRGGDLKEIDPKAKGWL